MSTKVTFEPHQMTVNGLAVNVVRKPIKNLHLGVYPPDGRVRVAAPLAVSDDAVRLAMIGKLGWIKRRKAVFASQPRQSRRELVSGENHYFLGNRYRLRVIRTNRAGKIVCTKSRLELHIREETTREQRARVLQGWYRERLNELIPSLLEKWQPVVGIEVAEWGVRRMKTRWGTCNVEARRIWLNLELVKKPVLCLEYVIVHELVHLLERRHNDHFLRLMDQTMPQWRLHREELNRVPLSHEDWEY